MVVPKLAAVPKTQFTTKSDNGRSTKSYKKSRNASKERSTSGMRTGRSEKQSIQKIKIPKFGKGLSKKDLNQSQYSTKSKMSAKQRAPITQRSGCERS